MLVKAAVYGAGDQRVDVTGQVARMVVNGALTILGDVDLNRLFGDPAFGVPKTLGIEIESPDGSTELHEVAEKDGRVTSPVLLGTPVRRPMPHEQRPGRMACLYAYFEKNAHYRANLEYFLRHAIEPDIDYVFVVNGGHSATFPQTSNVKVIERPNAGFDFAAHGAGLGALEQTYDYYFFVNATARGPFMAPYTDLRWTDPFTALLNDETMLAGASIAVQHNADWSDYFAERYGWARQALPAVESYFFALTRAGLDRVRADGVFDGHGDTDVWDVVFKREIGMSVGLLAGGAQIDCLIPEMQGVDYRECFGNFNPSHFTPTSPSGCFGRSLHPYEVVFIKQNRGICDAEVDSLSAYFDRPCG